ncbi:MAG: proteasome accessory factor PafA2 family protein [Acidobacteriota bacterium]
MMQRLMGVETEYAFTPMGRNGASLRREPILEKMIKLAKARFPHIRAAQNFGIYLGNGARFYIDRGLHPEMCSPECTDPWEIVRYVKAGERILLDLTRELESTIRGLEKVHLFRTNVDYGGTGATWGFHESYLCRADLEALAEQIIPHLISRVIFGGAGGFETFPAGLEFTLSPRASHIDRVESDDSMRHRGIFHTKEESLCGHGYRRLHILCGNSLGSETALWLTIATTAVIIALIDAGKNPGNDVRLKDPLAAYRAFCMDPECEAEAPLIDKTRATAISIQRHYLAVAEAHADAGFMPPWTGEVCGRWRWVLDSLEQKSEGLKKSLDWVMKHALYTEQIRQHQMSWDQLGVWTAFLHRVRKGLNQALFPGDLAVAERILAGRTPLREQVRPLTPALKKVKLGLEDLDRFFALRQKLFEIDTRFSELGEGGIFSTLEQAGVLDHRVVDDEEIREAKTVAPPGGRARIRGEFIRKLTRDRDEFRCSWENVCDVKNRRTMDLSHPFENQERWRDLGLSPELPLDPEDVTFLDRMGL